MIFYLLKGLLAVVYAATVKIPTYLNGEQYLIVRKDGISYEDVEAILSNLYRQNQKIEKQMAEYRAAAMKQRDIMEKTDKDLANLESRIIEQDKEMVVMKREIRKLKTKVYTKGTILEQVLHENKKCVADLQSSKKSIEHIEKVVNTDPTHVKIERDPRKAIVENSRNVSQNENIKSSSSERTKDLDKNASMRTCMSVSMSKLQGDNNISTLKTEINSKQLNNGKGVLPKRDTATEGVAFSAYLDHEIYHMGSGHTIKCNQVLLNDGNHYNNFTGIFTVPQTGVYLLTFSFGVQHAPDKTSVRLVVNNREIVDATGQVLGTWQRSSSSNTAIIRLNLDESVWLENIITGSEVVSMQGYRYTTFSGVRLY